MTTSTSTCRCGATVPDGADWCSQCLEPVLAAPAVPEAAPPSAQFAADGPSRVERVPRTPERTGRFAKTEVSFGLTGRIVVTVMLLIPALWFVFLAKELFSIGGLVLYVGVILPWAMRDLWRHPRRNL